MFELPKRVSLSERAAESIRKAILEGAWENYLPSERRLCEIFKVSRPTIRTALHLLSADGWLEIRPGRRNRLRPRVVPAAPPETRLVCVVTQLPVSNWSQSLYQAFSETRLRLAAEGFTMEVLSYEPAGGRAPQAKLEAFLAQNRVFCCILLSASRELQSWFSRQSVPALVLGSCDPGVRLPSFEIDMRATCLHATGVLLRHGHRRLAYVVPDTRRGGDLAGERGFLEALDAAARRYNARGVVVRHDNSTASLLPKIDAVLQSPEPPTGFLVAVPQHVYSVMFHLLRRGYKIPEQISIIARDHEPYFATVTPKVSHYEFEGDAYARRLTRLMIRLVRDGYLTPKPRHILQRYFEGDTVGPCPSQPLK